MSKISHDCRAADDCFVVTRSGEWMRRDLGGDLPVGYSNFATGVSIEIMRDPTGRPSYLSADRDPADDSYNIYTRVRTGERDAHLGETCEIWRYTHDTEPRDDSIRLSCVTDDGVELWSGSLNSDGEVIKATHAISVERRRVRADEVRSPADALDWEAWTSGIAAMPDAPNDEVILVPSPSNWSRGDPAVIRRRAGWTYSAGQGWRSFNPGLLSVFLTHEAGGLYLNYSADSDGPLRLSIVRQSVQGERIGPLIETEVSETVLGERCIWSGWVGRPECLTSDGLVLWTRMTSDRVYMHVEHKATQVRRGGVSADDMQPPSEAFTWLQ